MTYGYFIVVRNQSTFVASLVVLFSYENFIISTVLEGGAYVGIDAVKSPASSFSVVFYVQSLVSLVLLMVFCKRRSG